MPSPLGLVFTIEIDGKPTLAFEARQLREAAELCKEQWLRADLDTLSSNGVPLYGVGSKLRARMANELERATYQEALQPHSRLVIFSWRIWWNWMVSVNRARL
jgi:hypothetical protein